jgi:hypothetical protein
MDAGERLYRGEFCWKHKNVPDDIWQAFELAGRAQHATQLDAAASLSLDEVPASGETPHLDDAGPKWPITKRVLVAN